jgi:hypothetical protein
MATAQEFAAQTWPNYFPGGASHPNVQAHWEALPRGLKDAALAAAGGDGAAAGDLSPAGLARVFRQPDVTLPRADEAKGAFRDLQLSGVTGLQKLLASDPQANRARIAKAIYDNAAANINYEGDRLVRDVKEAQNAKNVLHSSATGDYFLDPIERSRFQALERASNDAYLAAGAEGRADQTSALTALGQAFSEGATGLQGEANVETANRTANQGATQAGYQTGIARDENALTRKQQESQFGRSLTQQKELQEAGFANAREIASAAGVGNLVSGGFSGLARLFGPAINNALANRFPIFRTPPPGTA